MSITTAIAAAQQKVANAYTAVSNKGGTLPATQNLSNLPTAINSISGGVDTTGWIPKTVSNGKVSNNNKLPDITGVTQIDHYVYPYAYYDNKNITGNIDFSNITTIGLYGCYNMFNGAYNVTSANLDNLSSITENSCYHMFSYTRVSSASLPKLAEISYLNACYGMFRGISSLTSVSFPLLTTVSGSYGLAYAFFDDSNLTSSNVYIPNLQTISGSWALNYTFGYCTGLTSFSFPNLQTISSYYGCAYAFEYCSGLTNFSFPKLSSLTGSGALRYCFYNCTSLTSLSFPALNSTSFGSNTDQFYRMLSGVTGCTVHFPSNLQSVIGSWSDVQAGFGGTRTAVLYDLPATS